MSEDTKQDSQVGIWLKVAALVVAILGFAFGAGFIRNQYLKPNLKYTVLDSYELSDQVFSGLVVENIGRSKATDIEIISNLGTEIIEIHTPPTYEPYILEGGPKTDGFRIHMDRLTNGTGLTIYLLTKEVPAIENNLLVTSDEGIGTLSSDPSSDALKLTKPLLSFSASLIALSFLLNPLLSRLYNSAVVVFPRRK